MSQHVSEGENIPHERRKGKQARREGRTQGVLEISSLDTTNPAINLNKPNLLQPQAEPMHLLCGAPACLSDRGGRGEGEKALSKSLSLASRRGEARRGDEEMLLDSTRLDSIWLGPSGQLSSDPISISAAHISQHQPSAPARPCFNLFLSLAWLDSTRLHRWISPVIHDPEEAE